MTIQASSNWLIGQGERVNEGERLVVNTERRDKSRRSESGLDVIEYNELATQE